MHADTGFPDKKNFKKPNVRTIHRLESVWLKQVKVLWLIEDGIHRYTVTAILTYVRTYVSITGTIKLVQVGVG